jgi:N-acetyl sugar amidotransferase
MTQICKRCVMDAQVPNIRFDKEGNCNYCEEFLGMMERTVHPDPLHRQATLERFVDDVKREGQGKPYDCIIGLSGGVDSAWVLYQAKLLGLRPLAVHMDNGWNSELAQSNIEGIVRHLNVDLYTHVIDWHEYRELMQAFFDADVIDVELLYDNAMLAVNYRLAAKYGVKSILAGTNNSTEGMRMPTGWNWYKFDAYNIKSIAKRRGVSFKTFPLISGFKKIYYEKARSIRWISFLDLLEYKKSEALQVLQSRCSYRPYPYKHYESIFTRFYQGYILPNKFSIDKRKVHLSTLILTKQANRKDALVLLDEIPYPSSDELTADKNYFIKKMGWAERDLIEYIKRPPRPHLDYGSELNFRKLFKRAINAIWLSKAPLLFEGESVDK